MSGQPLTDVKPLRTEELEEGRSWWKVCCAGCCLGFVALGVVIFFGARLFWGSGPTRITRLPDQFPSQLALFRPEAAAEMLYYPGTSKTAATRIITGPLEWLGGLFPDTATSSVRSVGSAIAAQARRLEGRDSITIRWEKLRASREDVLRFYAGALRGAGMSSQATDPNGTWEVHLTGANASMTFDLLMSDDPDVIGIDTMVIAVDYPASR
jgi:hypothetical protein